ncbi:hypothetical protein N1851_002080 [Merluccius polli]|uniref:Uncharacterized protein n=1 Tax=Merluccius polli TaxID=89951 RepID=A0AA47PDD7_MERPO|nr:hypothetical protein N1851_002080 [Merluccius polli]
MHNMLSWDNMIKYSNMCLMYKVINNLTSPPLKKLVQVRTSAYHSTRGAARGDCIIPLRKSQFGQSTFSHKAAQEWNTIPAHIRELDSHPSFKFPLKKWFIHNQMEPRMESGGLCIGIMLCWRQYQAQFISGLQRREVTGTNRLLQRVVTRDMGWGRPATPPSPPLLSLDCLLMISQVFADRPPRSQLALLNKLLVLLQASSDLQV